MRLQKTTALLLITAALIPFTLLEGNNSKANASTQYNEVVDCKSYMINLDKTHDWALDPVYAIINTDSPVWAYHISVNGLEIAQLEKGSMVIVDARFYMDNENDHNRMYHITYKNNGKVVHGWIQGVVNWKDVLDLKLDYPVGDDYYVPYQSDITYKVQ